MAWNANEIVQGDSGLVVSNKLDAEFARIQADELEVWNKFNTLLYANYTQSEDASEDSVIISPQKLWHIVGPRFSTIAEIEKVTDHLEEVLFDGTFWIRSDVLIEYTGPYVETEDLAVGSFVTKAHIQSLENTILGQALLRDGSIPLNEGYAPVNDQDIATKKYVADVANLIYSYAETNYIEYPSSSQGDTTFAASISGRNIAVYVNGILWRSTRYAVSGVGFQFHDQLDEGDEVTLIILGKKEI